MVEPANAQWKIAKIGEKQSLTAKISTSYRKSTSLNLFPVTDLRPEVKLMHILRHADIIVMFETEGIGQIPSSLERYLVSFIFWPWRAAQAQDL